MILTPPFFFLFFTSRVHRLLLWMDDPKLSPPYLPLPTAASLNAVFYYFKILNWIINRYTCLYRLIENGLMLWGQKDKRIIIMYSYQTNNGSLCVSGIYQCRDLNNLISLNKLNRFIHDTDLQLCKVCVIKCSDPRNTKPCVTQLEKRVKVR